MNLDYERIFRPNKKKGRGDWAMTGVMTGGAVAVAMISYVGEDALGALWKVHTGRRAEAHEIDWYWNQVG